jgi:cell wall-associated NlpC family hydrolase
MIDITDLIGKPFRMLARGPDAFDCMGLVIEIFKRAGIEIPDPVEDPEGAEARWVELDPGSLWDPFTVIGFAKTEFVGHVGLYLGWGLVIHARENRGIEIMPLSKFPERIVKAYAYRY